MIRSVFSFFKGMLLYKYSKLIYTMIIDAHVHISLYNDNADNLENAFTLLLSDMKKNEVDFVVVIPDNNENSPYITDLDKSIELINDHQNIFLLGSPQIIQRGASEIEKYEKLATKKIVKGVKFFPGHDPYLPTDDRCMPYYEMCVRQNIPVLFHTGENSGDSECSKWNDPKHIVSIAKKFPSLKVIIAHYFWPKMKYCYEITKEISNIYFDVSAMADDEVLEKSGGINEVRKILTKTVFNRPDNILYGTDWPMCKMNDHIALIKSLSLKKEQEEKIFYKNAINIYNLPV